MFFFFLVVRFKFNLQMLFSWADVAITVVFVSLFASVSCGVQRICDAQGRLDDLEGGPRPTSWLGGPHSYLSMRICNWCLGPLWMPGVAAPSALVVCDSRVAKGISQSQNKNKCSKWNASGLTADRLASTSHMVCKANVDSPRKS